MEVVLSALSHKQLAINEKVAQKFHYIEISIARTMPSAVNFTFLQTLRYLELLHKKELTSKTCLLHLRDHFLGCFLVSDGADQLGIKD